MRIFAVGDIVGTPGVEFVRAKLWGLRKLYSVDLCVANGENSAPGNGLDPSTADTLLSAGVDIITGGNHIWRRREIYQYLDSSVNVIRPANYPSACPGSGYAVADVSGWRVLVINLMGNLYMDNLDCPFACAGRILKREKGRYDFAAVDFHAEATSEKAALAKHLDGHVSAVFGTHTHVQTSDERVLPRGTGFITDLGMTGPADSVLGIKNEYAIERFLTKMPVRHEVATGECKLEGAVFEVDEKSGRCTGVERVRVG